MAPTPMCPHCEQSPETPLHLLRDCFYSRLVWESVSLLPTNFFYLNFDSWLKRNAIIPRRRTNSPYLWPFIFLATIWHLWKSRNRLVFEGQRSLPHLVARQAHTFALETRFALESVNLIHDTRAPRWVFWTPPPHPYLKLNTDGTYNHHSGKAAARRLIHDHNGCWVHGFAVNVGLTTSFLAELWGCREGLKLANSLGIQQLVFEMDSLLAIQLIQNQQVSARPTSGLLTNIFVLIDSFSNCLVQHTLREGNSAAAFMASMGHDLALGTKLFPTPPVGIHMILQSDYTGTMFLRK
ncbi:hypothetical protein SLA2020_488250 [Shorea laevis]